MGKSKLIYQCLGFSIFSFLTCSLTSAVGQELSNSKDPELKQPIEKISVTGSRISRTDLETATPIVLYSPEDIQNNGVGTVAEFLRVELAEGGFNESSTLSQSLGASAVGLRGFSSSYTLVLLNGHRVPKNSAGSLFTDMNQLPLAAVERIEVLNEGAAAIYGSDAVAGVINIITKKEFDGLSASVRYGAGIEHWDANEVNASLVAGVSKEHTQMLLAVEHFRRDPVMAKNRDLGYTAFIEGRKGGEGRSTWGIPGSTYIRGEGWAPWASCPKEDVHVNGRCRYDFAPLYQLQPHSNRQSIFTAVDHEINADLHLNAQFRYTRAFTKTSNAPAPGAVDASESPYVKDFLFNDRYQDNPKKAEAIYQKIQNGEAAIRVGRRYLDFPNRQIDATNETFEGVTGLGYDIDDEWHLDFELGFSRLSNRRVGAGGQLLRKDISEAFNQGVLNPFILNNCASAELKKVCEDLQASIHRTGEYKIAFSSLVVTGSLPLTMPGGKAGVAIGVDVRKEKYRDRSDPASAKGEVIGGAGSNGGGQSENMAGFIELSLPLLAKWEVNLATRYDKADWQLNQASDVTYNVSSSYKPTDSLMLRASYNTGFKVPSLDDLYLGSSFGVRFAVDTKLCNQAKKTAKANETPADCKKLELRSKGGGNPDLQSEQSRSMNVGLVYEPFDQLSVSIDYWSLEVSNIIGSLGIQEILDEEAQGKLTELVKRNDNGRLDDGVGSGFVQTNYQNLTESNASGITYDIRYRDELNMGTVKAKFRVEQMLKDENQTSKVQPLCDGIKDKAKRRFRLNGTIGWQQEDYGSSIHVRWLPGYSSYDKRNTAERSCQLLGYYDVDFDDEGKIIEAGEPEQVKSYIQIDLNGYYHLTPTQKLSEGIRNLFDAQPPFSQPYNWPFYSRSRFNNIGRFIYLQYDLKF